MSQYLLFLLFIYLFAQKREEEEAARLREEEKVSTYNTTVSNEVFPFMFYFMNYATHILFSSRKWSKNLFKNGKIDKK